MNWLTSVFVGLLTALVAGAAGGLIAAGCVSWYRVSSREGLSGYFVVEIILLSAFIGLLAGIATSRLVSGFFTASGAASGSILALAGVVAWIAWGLADIPPTIDGHELDLVVEVRLPKGAEKPPVVEGKQFVWLETGPRSGPARKSESGVLETAKAGLDEGRWLVPGRVHIFTARDPRRLVVALDDKTANGFELHFPGHPGPGYKQWSTWLPDAELPNWPDSQMSYRFRIEEIVPVATTAQDPFAALTSDSPLREWLLFFDGWGRQPEKDQAILAQIKSRPADFAAVLRSSNDEDARLALNAAYVLNAYDSQVVQAMRDLATEFVQEIRKYNAMDPQDEAAKALGARIQARFNHWCIVWGKLQETVRSDGKKPVAELLQVASVKTNDPIMQAVADDARRLLDQLKQ